MSKSRRQFDRWSAFDQVDENAQVSLERKNQLKNNRFAIDDMIYDEDLTDLVFEYPLIEKVLSRR